MADELRGQLYFKLYSQDEPQWESDFAKVTSKAPGKSLASRLWGVLTFNWRAKMADEKLNELKREMEENPDDQNAKYRFRVEAVRAGRGGEAGFEVGDEVDVEEKESPWVKGNWRGVVLRVFDAGDKYIRPLTDDKEWRVKPSPEYFQKGLYLTKEDSVTLVVPIAPGEAEKKIGVESAKSA